MSRHAFSRRTRTGGRLQQMAFDRIHDPRNNERTSTRWFAQFTQLVQSNGYRQRDGRRYSWHPRRSPYPKRPR